MDDASTVRKMGLDDVFRLLERATCLEKDGQRIEASTKYYEGCHLMRQIVSKFPPGDTDPVVGLLKEKIQFYTLEAQRLYFDEATVVAPPTAPATITLAAATDDISVLTVPGSKPSVSSDIQKKVILANARFKRAIDLDEINNKTNNITNNNKQVIVESYMNAAETFLSAVKLAEESSLSLPKAVLRRLAACLERAEELKHPLLSSPSASIIR
jgi:hypothetical protein